MWAFLTAALLLQAPPACAVPPPLRLESLNVFTTEAHNVVDLTLDAPMLRAAAMLMGTSDPAARALAEGLDRVVVRNLEFDREGVYADGDAESVRAQFVAPWTAVLSLNTRDDHRRVDVYAMRGADRPCGLAAVVAEPRRLLVVDILGRIDLQELARLKGLAGMPDVLGAIMGGGRRP